MFAVFFYGFNFNNHIWSDSALYLFQWQGVLDIIAKALFDNNMEFSQINGIHKFQVGKTITLFYASAAIQN